MATNGDKLCFAHCMLYFDMLITLGQGQVVTLTFIYSISFIASSNFQVKACKKAENPFYLLLSIE